MDIEYTQLTMFASCCRLQLAPGGRCERRATANRNEIIDQPQSVGSRHLDELLEFERLIRRLENS